MVGWLAGWFYNVSAIIGLLNVDVIFSNVFMQTIWFEVRKVGEHSRGRAEGFLFNSYYTKV